MNKPRLSWQSLCFLALALPAAVGHAENIAKISSPAAEAQSPDRRVAITVTYAAGMPRYRVSFDGKVVVVDSPLGLSLEPGGVIGAVRESSVESRTIDQTYSLIAGKTSSARDHCIETTAHWEEIADPHRKVNLILRAYDDAVAFRYALPEQAGLTDFALTSEDSTFSLPPDAEAWSQPLRDFTTPHEGRFHHGTLAEISGGQKLGLPLLYHAASGPWVAITEANLTDYAGVYLQAVSDKPGTFTSSLSPLPGQKKIKVRGRAPHPSPWRVFIVGDSPGRLIESNVVLNLSEPCALNDTSWITPGKVAFLWWNGYVVAPPNQVGPLNTATIETYIDFAADHHIQFASIDGSDHAWYGGPCAPYKGADVAVPLPEIDMPAIFAHAQERGVRMRIWVNYHGLKRQIDRALEQYARWGAEGVMIDMIERDDQENLNLLRRMIAKCADLHLTVTLHNMSEPTGLERTYPNLRTTEGVLNLEYNKWDPVGCTPEHELTVPFIRMLAGPMDFHQGGFRSVRPEEFKPHNIAPVVMGTRAHQMAMYVVYEDALPMIVDYPAAYEKQEGFDFVCSVPTTWDETHVIEGEVGQHITIVRRKGNEWYVGSMTVAAKEIKIPLSFLPSNVPYLAESWADDDSRGPNGVVHQKKTVTSMDALSFVESAAGGHVVHLTPVKPDR